MDSYQRYIAISKYARFLPDEGRRETWEETVHRYCTFFHTRYPNLFDYNEMFYSISTLEVMPSMRALMSAGPALERTEIAGYNCSFVCFDDVRAFDELLYISMCSTGVGFSVERQFISKLPEIAGVFRDSEHTIVVEDSKEGWGAAFRELIHLLYAGIVPKWDLSKLRPKGAVLKTFGGRSSGPEPLNQLFKFCVATFKNAAGRKLESIEVHDINCVSGMIVVSGGVRRSALISLSNLSDLRMRDAKNGQFWINTPHRSMSNNSVAYTEKPELKQFLDEFTNLYTSGSGERGIFNRAGSIRKGAGLVDYEGNARPRVLGHDIGANPCVTGDTMVMTDQGPKQVTELLDTPYIAVVDGKHYNSTAFWFSGNKPVYQIKTKRGYLVEATDNHKIKVQISRRQSHGKNYTVYDWKSVSDLKIGDKLVLSNNRRLSIDLDIDQFNKGWLLGEIKGNGGHNTEYTGGTYVRFWNGSHDLYQIADKVVKELGVTTHYQGGSFNTIHNTIQCSPVCLVEFVEKYLTNKDKQIKLSLEQENLSFVTGFLRGFFDSDGSVQGDNVKGKSVRLSQACLSTLQSVQRMLSRVGIASTIYEFRKKEGLKFLPDGKGGESLYFCNDLHELVISKDNIVMFEHLIGFYHKEKAKKLSDLLEDNIRKDYKEYFISEVSEIIFIGNKDVYDCTVEDVHCFDANGIIVHNCAEITLRNGGFCNLSEVVVRPDDTLNTLENKVRIASTIGTFQSTLTDFPYIRPIWKQNAEEERLLGVSLTGIMDHPILSETNHIAIKWLNKLRSTAQYTNSVWAQKLGIPLSKAITCVKPSGTVSQLVNSASGMHPRYSDYYIRTVRGDYKDPVSQWMIEHGVPHETDLMNSNNVVFSFPIASPRGSKTVKHTSALRQLEHWKMYAEHFVEHNPSITVYYKDEEFLDVMAWVHKNFDICNGLSFLPFSNHPYPQAPYQEIDEAKYNLAKSQFPELDWSTFKVNEYEDNTTASQEFACIGGQCEI